MSKIFEALNRGTDDLAESLRPLIEEPEQLKGEDGAAPVEMPKPEAAPQTAAPAVPTRPAHVAPEAAPSKEPAVQARRLPLRIAAPSPLFPFDADCWEASEQYRIVRAKLGQHPRQPRLIVVSSPGAEDGKSVTAANVAAALSLKDQIRVLLLEADMRRPTLADRLGIPKVPGLADVLMGACSLEQALVQTEELPNLYVITAGTAPPNAAELLEREQWHATCARMRSLFRYTIMDSPPMAAVADFDLIQADCDGLILVVRPDRTNRTLCKKSLEIVPKAKLLGVLLNCVPDWSFAKKTHYDYYYRPSREGND
jgi:protein-tyrosine kinase